MVTKYHLVYENLELKMFYPGQLIMSIHQRSPLCVEYQEFYKDGTSRFRRDIDNRAVGKQNPNEHKEIRTEYTNLIAVLNEGQESKKLQKMKTKIKNNKNAGQKNITGKISNFSSEESPEFESSK